MDNVASHVGSKGEDEVVDMNLTADPVELSNRNIVKKYHPGILAHPTGSRLVQTGNLEPLALHHACVVHAQLDIKKEKYIDKSYKVKLW